MCVHVCACVSVCACVCVSVCVCVRVFPEEKEKQEWVDSKSGAGGEGRREGKQRGRQRAKEKRRQAVANWAAME